MPRTRPSSVMNRFRTVTLLVSRSYSYLLAIPPPPPPPRVPLLQLYRQPNVILSSCSEGSASGQVLGPACIIATLSLHESVLVPPTVRVIQLAPARETVTLSVRRHATPIADEGTDSEDAEAEAENLSMLTCPM